MGHRLSSRIALRYLFSKKSHSAVSVISAVSIVGVAVATAALVCVLSVFNGFRDVLGDRLNLLSADVVIAPSKGRVISNPDSLMAKLRGVEGVGEVMGVVSDNALAVYSSHEMPVRVKGVDGTSFRRMTSIDSIMLDNGCFAAETKILPGVEDEYGFSEDVRHSRGTVSIGVASRLAIYEMESYLQLYTPRKGERLNPANPLASFVRDSIAVAGVYQSQQSDYDDDMVITDIETARNLFELEDEVTSIEMSGASGVSPSNLAEKVRKVVPEGLVVKDRLEQQEMNFRMIEIEKWVTFLLLFFILLIAGFNLVSTLSMLILEKRNGIVTLHSLGMTKRDIGGIFAWESMYVTLAGGAGGMVLGVVLSLLQEHYGLIKLNGDPETLVIKSYPVVLEWMDLPIVMIPVIVIGLLTAFISAGYARRKLR